MVARGMNHGAHPPYAGVRFLAGSAGPSSPSEPTTVLYAIGSWLGALSVAAVARALAERAHVRQVLVHAGDEADRRIVGELLTELVGRPPDHHIATDGATELTSVARVLAGAEEIVRAEQPQVVVLGGHGPLAFGYALVAAKLGVAIARLGAGGAAAESDQAALRGLADRLADTLFTEDADAARGLLVEGIPSWRLHASGATLADAVRIAEPTARGRCAWDAHGLQESGYTLVACDGAHPAGETGATPTLAVAATPEHGDERAGLGYLDLLSLIGGARDVITDSRRVEVEARALGTPCRRVSGTTERPGTGVAVPARGAERRRPADVDRRRPSERVADVLAANYLIRSVAPGTSLPVA